MWALKPGRSPTLPVPDRYPTLNLHPTIHSQVKPDLSKAIEALKAKGVQGKVGIVGFCWGGKISTLASQVRLFTQSYRGD